MLSASRFLFLWHLWRWNVYGVQVLLRDVGMSASTEWRQIERQLRDLDPDVPGALDQRERQRLFLEVRGELGTEQGFKALLESALEISAATSWPLAKRHVRHRNALPLFS